MTQSLLRLLALSLTLLAFATLPALAQTPQPVDKNQLEAVPAETDIDLINPIPQPATQPAPAPGMTITQAAIIGVVEGITEYLPISSTGHIILTQRAMGIGTESKDSKDAADAFAICVQAGAILAVIGLYFSRVKQGIRGLMGQDAVGKRLAINLIVAVIPALIIGKLLSEPIKKHIFGLWPISIAWLLGGIAILYVSYRHIKPTPTSDSSTQDSGPQTRDSNSGFTLDVLNWQSALLVGLAQCIAMWPGTSRSLVTIVAGVLVGMSLPAAVEFSFLLGVITLTAATVNDLKDHGKLMLDAYGALTLFVGFFAAFISALAAIEWLVNFLKKRSMAVFGYYRIALALIVIGLLLADILHN